MPTVTLKSRSTTVGPVATVGVIIGVGETGGIVVSVGIGSIVGVIVGVADG